MISLVISIAVAVLVGAIVACLMGQFTEWALLAALLTIVLEFFILVILGACKISGELSDQEAYRDPVKEAEQIRRHYYGD